MRSVASVMSRLTWPSTLRGCPCRVFFFLARRLGVSLVPGILEGQPGLTSLQWCEELG